MSKNAYIAKQLLGAHPIITVTDKYMRKRQISWGNPCIWLCNEDPYYDFNSDLRNWLDGNVVRIHLTQPLF